MSDKNLSRRAEAVTAISGVDVTDDIRPYFKYLEYTEYEEGEADDIRIGLQDRDRIWLQEWLDSVIEAAASSPSAAEISARATVYFGSSGEEVRTMQELLTRQGYSLPLYGADGYFGSETCAAVIAFQRDHALAADGICGPLTWAALLSLSDGAQVSAASSVETGLEIEARIIRRNWKGDGKDDYLDCGSFEMDSVDYDGPPAEAVIRGTALPFRAQIRRTEKTRGWEGMTLSGILSEIARGNGMTCMFLAADDPLYERVEQYRMTDIAFAKRLCEDAGISLKAARGTLVAFDQREYEAKAPALKIDFGDGSYTEYHLSAGEADTQYGSCRVSYNDPESGKSIEGVAYAGDYGGSGDDRRLEITAKVGSIAEAKALAAWKLRLHNKFCRTVEFTMPGEPAAVAGVTMLLTGWGGWSGKYIIKQVTHRVDGSGYTTKVIGRPVLEGY